MFGAITGIAMKTIITSDMTLAICRPPKQSRTTEIAMTRVAAAPTPCRNRKSSRNAKLGAKVEASAAAM